MSRSPSVEPLAPQPAHPTARKSACKSAFAGMAPSTRLCTRRFARCLEPFMRGPANPERPMFRNAEPSSHLCVPISQQNHDGVGQPASKLPPLRSPLFTPQASSSRALDAQHQDDRIEKVRSKGHKNAIPNLLSSLHSSDPAEASGSTLAGSRQECDQSVLWPYEVAETVSRTSQARRHEFVRLFLLFAP